MSEWTEHFKRQAAEDFPDLPLMPKPCHDCAVPRVLHVLGVEVKEGS